MKIVTKNDICVVYDNSIKEYHTGGHFSAIPKINEYFLGITDINNLSFKNNDIIIQTCLNCTCEYPNIFQKGRGYCSSECEENSDYSENNTLLLNKKNTKRFGRDGLKLIFDKEKRKEIRLFFGCSSYIDKKQVSGKHFLYPKYIDDFIDGIYFINSLIITKYEDTVLIFKDKRTFNSLFYCQDYFKFLFEVDTEAAKTKYIEIDPQFQELKSIFNIHSKYINKETLHIKV